MDTREWTRTFGDQAFLVSTSRKRLPHSFVQKAFGSDAMYWAQPLSEADMKRMLDSSCTFGLYKLESGQAEAEGTAVGLGRLVTDYVTFAWLTDVYIEDGYRQLGLGGWLAGCIGEYTQEMPALRRIMLATSSEHAARMYQRVLGMSIRTTEPEMLLFARQGDLAAAGTNSDEAGAAQGSDGRTMGSF